MKSRITSLWSVRLPLPQRSGQGEGSGLGQLRRVVGHTLRRVKQHCNLAAISLALSPSDLAGLFLRVPVLFLRVTKAQHLGTGQRLCHGDCASSSRFRLLGGHTSNLTLTLSIQVLKQRIVPLFKGFKEEVTGLRTLLQNHVDDPPRSVLLHLLTANDVHFFKIQNIPDEELVHNLLYSRHSHPLNEDLTVLLYEIH